MRFFWPRPDREDRYLLALLRDGPRAGFPADPARFDWTSLIHRAGRHQVLPLVLEALLPRGDAPARDRDGVAFDVTGEIPPEAVTALHAARRNLTLYLMALEEELRRAAGALEKAGLAGLVLKGPALGRLAYRARELRFHGDLDLLVSRRDYDAAIEALGTEGFVIKNASLSRRYHRPFHYHDVLAGRGGLPLELHWGLSRRDDLFRLDPSRFLANGVPAPDGLPVLLTSPTDLLLHSAAQSFSEGFERLVRVCDADALLRRCGPWIDEDRLVADARRGGLGPSLWLLLRLARDLLGTPAASLMDRLGPARAARLGVESMTPEALLTSRASMHRPELRHLYTFWLVTGPSRRLRAMVRTVRLSALKVALRGPDVTFAGRARGFLGRLLGLSKMLAFQIVHLAMLPRARGQRPSRNR